MKNINNLLHLATTGLDPLSHLNHFCPDPHPPFSHAKSFFTLLHSPYNSMTSFMNGLLMLWLYHCGCCQNFKF